jgi:hypothetical protein
MATSMMQHNKYQDEQQDQVLLDEQKQNIWKLLTAPTNRTKSAAAAEPTADDVGTQSSLPRTPPPQAPLITTIIFLLFCCLFVCSAFSPLPAETRSLTPTRQ